MQPDFSFRSLTTGCNGQGISAVVTAGEISLESIDNIELREFRTTSIAARCIINAGDSVQRSCNENRIKLNKVNCVVVSSMAPHHVSGLAGLIQSMSDLGVGTLTIIGPAGLLGLLANMKSFVNRKYGMALVLFLVIILLSISYLCNIYIYIYIYYFALRYLSHLLYLDIQSLQRMRLALMETWSHKHFIFRRFL